VFEGSPPARGRWRWAGLLACLALVALRADAASALLGKQAPDFALHGLDGQNRRLSEYRGRVVLINFWARWAGDSRVEMPVLDRLNTTYRRAGLVVLGVSIDDDERHAGEFAAAMHVGYPILLDSGETVGRDYSLQRLPMTVLVDRSGIVRFVRVGYRRGDQPAYLAAIRELLRE